MPKVFLLNASGQAIRTEMKKPVHAEITPDANNPVSVSGKIIGTKKSKNGRRGKKWLVQLDKQNLEAGGQSAINWTETIPENAKLSSKAIIRVRAKAGKRTKSKKMTISITSLTASTPTPAVTPSPTPVPLPS